MGKRVALPCKPTLTRYCLSKSLAFRYGIALANKEAQACFERNDFGGLCASCGIPKICFRIYWFCESFQCISLLMDGIIHID
jgi:hypothetical protein